MPTKKQAVPAKKAHQQSAVTPAKKAAHKPPVRAGATSQPVFNQPAPSPDPTSFSKSVTDKKLKGIVKLEAFPPSGPDPAVLVEPALTLAQVYGSAGPGKEAAITKAGQIVFHCVGDTGSVTGPKTQDLVADKMVTDFDEANPADVPSFFYHLGDVVYYFGEATYYYDQFYEPYRDYPAPIVAIPGNHDGVIYPNDTAQSLDAFIANFCTPTPTHSPDAGGLNRTTMIQPAIYFTFEAPFVRIFGLYSNVLEDPGVISSQKGTSSPNTVLDDRQLAFLTAGLRRVTSDGFNGAVIIATHHPAFTGGSVHGGSPLMLADIDACCTAAGVWPHAVFSGHAHNYQRYTRTVNDKQIPFIVAGCGGHNPLSPMRATLRTPYVISDTLTLNSVDATDYGYTRIIINDTTMTIEYHPENDGGTTKTPDDVVTINLATYTVS
jgi:phosphoribosylcarboxyaminoimidazole (NCAIR) mutase